MKLVDIMNDRVVIFIDKEDNTVDYLVDDQLLPKGCKIVAEYLLSSDKLFVYSPSILEYILKIFAKAVSDIVFLHMQAINKKILDENYIKRNKTNYAKEFQSEEADVVILYKDERKSVKLKTRPSRQCHLNLV